MRKNPASLASLRHSLPAWFVLFLVALLWSQRAYLPFLVPQKVYAVPGTATFGGTGGLGGNVYGNIFYDHANTAYFLDPNATGTSLAVAGSVGIGTTGPAAKLDVVGTSGALARIQGTAAGAFNYILWANTAGTGRASMGYDNTLDAIAFGDASTQQVVIKQGGNVGIGTTNPGRTLVVNGQVAAYGGSGALDVYGRATNALAWAWYSPSGGTFRAYDYTVSQDRLTIDSGGNVGIGTTSPGALLQVGDGSGTTQRNIIINGGSGAVYNGLTLQTGGTEKWFLGRDGTDSTDDFILRASAATNVMRVFNSGAVANSLVINAGNVGIGTTGPGEKLQVKDGEINTLDASVGYGTQVSGRNRQTGAGTSQYNRGYVFSNLKFDGTNWITTTPSGSGFNDFSGMFFSNGGQLSFVTGQVSTATTNLGGDLGSYTRMVIAPGGKVGIGTTSPSGLAGDLTITRTGGDGAIYFGTTSNNYLYWSGTQFAKTGTTGWAELSDQRMKTDIQDLQYGLKEILQLKPKKYLLHNAIGDGGNIKIDSNGKPDIGLVAQDVYKVIPEFVVNKPKDEYKNLWTMNYTSLIPIIINAIKEQQKQIDELTSIVCSDHPNTTICAK